MSKKHECPRDNYNIIFYSPLWKGWVFKIIPANYKEAVKAGVDLPVVNIVIKHCPYCGVELK